MSKTEKIREYIINNPSISNPEVARLFGTTKDYVRKIRGILRAEGLIDKYDGDKFDRSGNSESKSTFTETSRGAEYTFNSPKRIISKEDLIEACDIDLSEWVIEKFLCNKWEVGAKDASKNIKVTPLFQVKLWLKPKLTVNQGGILEAIQELLDNYKVGKLKTIKQSVLNEVKACKATISDLHVGLDPNPNNKSIFNYKYDAGEFYKNLDKVYNSILKEFKTHGKFDLLILDDLGDGLDGWNGYTTRGGHKLDQNLDNVGQFKTYITGKLTLIENLINADVANKVLIRNVTDDNHSGDLSYIANTALEMILSRTYDKKNVEFYILNKFMEHFTYGDHTYILTHGKDSKNMFKGFPLDLNDKTIKLINDYIDHYRIRTKYIHLEKGDLHQVAYKKTKKFDYRNFMSFAPPSSYVQNNFGDSYSGYSIQVIPKHSGEVSHTDYFFDMVED